MTDFVPERPLKNGDLVRVRDIPKGPPGLSTNGISGKLGIVVKGTTWQSESVRPPALAPGYCDVLVGEKVHRLSPYLLERINNE